MQLIFGRDSWPSYSSILFNLARYRKMHSIAISLGVEDSVHLRTLPPLRPAFRQTFSLSLAQRSSKSAEKGLGVGRELHSADNTSWTDNKPARLSSYVEQTPRLTPLLSVPLSLFHSLLPLFLHPHTSYSSDVSLTFTATYQQDLRPFSSKNYLKEEFPFKNDTLLFFALCSSWHAHVGLGKIERN